MADEEVVDENEEVLEVPEVSEEDKRYEDRARRMGWRPKAEYGGDSSRWVDARTFVMRGEAELPILRERFRKMDERFATTETELKETKKQLKDASDVLVELRDMSRVSEERSYQRARQELVSQQKDAVREASEEKFDRIQRQLEQLEETVKPRDAAPVRAVAEPVRVDPAPAVMPNPEVQTWIASNPWFTNNVVLNTYAIDEERQVKAEYPEWSTTEQLEEVKKRTMEKFPEKFNNRRRTAATTVASSSAPPPRPKGRTAKDLPPDAKAAMTRFMAQIPGYTEADYLKSYFAGEE